MSFIDFPSPTPVFPTLPPLAWSVHKKPIMASRVSIAATGREVQLAAAVYPRWAFVLSYGNSSWLRDQTQNSTPYAPLAGFTEMEEISGLFLACRGAYGEFYYSDPDDNSRLNQGLAVSDGINTHIPLYYSWGNGPFAPSLILPVTGIQSIDAVYFNGVAQPSGNYSLDATKTVLILVAPAPNGVVITADFHFYYRCRFLEDHMEFSQWAKNLWELKEVKFESVKP